MIPETAVQAATDAIFEDDPRITESDAYDLASNALTAALPHLEAALRKQIAVSIEARKFDPEQDIDFHGSEIHNEALDLAASVARRGNSK